jgi:hypothetical protein
LTAVLLRSLVDTNEIDHVATVARDPKEAL